MVERIEFLVAYVGSAAMVAFLAACLHSARIDRFPCPARDTHGADLCVKPAVQPGPTRDAITVSDASSFDAAPSEGP